MILSLISLGCPKNTVDSEAIINRLSSSSVHFTYEPKNADAVLINTCGFIKSSLEETESVIEEMLLLKNENPNFKVIIFGCAVVRAEKELKQKYPELDGIFPLGHEKQIVEFLSKKPLKEDIIKDIYFNRNFSITLPHYAYIKISEGCDRKCAFCTIPSIRGKYISRKMESIIEEAKLLVKRGVKELIIIAQDTTNYGQDLYKKPMLHQLLQNLEKIEGLLWIRILYAYPDGITTDLMDYWLSSPKILNYIDLPIQHSHPYILEKMGRKKSFEKFNEVFNYLREKNPDFCIRTTVITGFPGETKEHFEHLINYMKEKKFDRLGVFAYQNEAGTKAFNYGKQLNENVKQKRLEKLMLLQQEIHFEKNHTLKNKNFDVIIDRLQGKGQYVGRSYRDAPDIDINIYFHSNNVFNVGDIVKVKIVSTLKYDLEGKA